MIEYKVLQPPTGGEVESLYLDAVSPENDGLITLLLRASHQQVPPPKNERVTFRIRRVGHPQIGGMVIEGVTEPGRDHISVITQPTADEPATAHIIK